MSEWRPFISVKGNSFIVIINTDTGNYIYNNPVSNINKLHLIANFTLDKKKDEDTMKKIKEIIYDYIENYININKIILDYTGCDTRYMRSLIRDPQYDNIIQFRYLWNGLYKILKGYHILYVRNDKISVKLQLNKFDRLKFALSDKTEYEIYSRANNLYIRVNSRKEDK